MPISIEVLTARPTHASGFFNRKRFYLKTTGNTVTLRVGKDPWKRPEWVKEAVVKDATALGYEATERFIQEAYAAYMVAPPRDQSWRSA